MTLLFFGLWHVGMCDGSKTGKDILRPTLTRRFREFVGSAKKAGFSVAVLEII